MELGNIEIKKTKVSVTVDNHFNNFESSGENEAKDLIFNLILIDKISINHLSQILDMKLSGYEIGEVIYIKERIKELTEELKTTIGFDDKRINKELKETKRHKFH